MWSKNHLRRLFKNADYCQVCSLLKSQMWGTVFPCETFSLVFLRQCALFFPNIKHTLSTIKNTAKGILIPLQVFNSGFRIYPDSKYSLTQVKQEHGHLECKVKVNYSGNQYRNRWERTSSVVRIPSASLAMSSCHILSVYSRSCLLLRVSHSYN